MSLKTVRSASRKLKSTVMFVASFALVLGSVSAAVPVFLTQTAAAIDATIVTKSNLSGWSTNSQVAETRAGSDVSFVSDSAAGTLGHGALKITTDSTTQTKAQFMLGFTPVALSSITGSLGYSTKQNSASFAGGNASYQIQTFLNGGTSGYTTLGYEPYVNFGEAAIHGGEWQPWDVTNGLFFSSKTIAGLEGGVQASQGQFTYTLDQIKAKFPNATVFAYGLNVGSGNPSYNVEADNFSFNGIKYDFEPIIPATPTNLRLANVNGEFTCGGATNINYITPKWNAVDGAVSYNYRLTLNGQTIINSTSVGDVTSVSGAFGGQGLSTFSLQAVNTDGTTSDWSAPCAVIYDATAPDVPTISSPLDNSIIANIQKVSWGAVTDDFANPVTYIYQSSTNSGTNVDDGSFTSPAYTSSNLSDTQISTLGTPEGTYYLHVKAVDAAGNMSAWSTTVKVTVDNTAPVAIISTPTAGKVSGHTLNIEGTATDANFNYYYCYVTNANGEVGIRDPQCVTAWSAGSLFHSAFATTITGTSNSHLGTVDLTGLSSGDAYQVHLVAYDKAGNSTEATPVSFTLDNSAPVALINAVATDTTQPTITGTLDDVYADFTVKLDGNSLDVSRKDTGWSAFVTTPLSYGTHTLVATGTDLAGNPFETTRDFTTVAPAALAPVFTPPVAVIAPAPLPQNLVAFAATPAATNDTAVLGASTTDAPAVAGAETSKKVAAAATNNDGNVFGVSWYWLLAIPAAIGAGWWATAAYRRRDV